MDEPEHGQHEPTLSSSAAATSGDGPSSASPSMSRVQEEEEEGVENERHENGDSSLRRHRHYPLHHILLNHHRQQQQQSSNFSYRVNISISDVPSTEMRDDVWSCLVVLVTFWFFAASVTLILGFFGSANTRLGPNCSRLIQSNPFFVQSIKVEEVDEPKPGPILYGFYKPPPLDIEIAWTETHMAFVPANLHKEWIYFLNKGSRVDILYNVKSTSPSPLSLVIAQGRESLIEWIEDPSYPNTTLSWNIISGSGKIQQKISKPSNYYIAVGNLHSEEVEVELQLSINALVYNTTEAYYKCSLGNYICSLKLFLLGRNVAVLTSPHPMEGTDVGWYVKLSFGPRWITYFLGSGIMTILILSAFRFSNTFQTTDENPTGFQAGELGTEQVPLLMHKDDDISSWGSSYDSVSQDDEDPEARLAVNGIEGQQITEGESINNPRCLCVICFDAPRDCFFLPCGHCAACFTCGTRIAEEAGTCPICRRKMKKVRKIFSV
ncbi:E3 ubiquitin-protein ligase APD2-like isoform X1 [Carya illinoinensis]|uniref:E3 ubiquitin-protein ligase APD2-like isoform X1 n=1 Tax=Carya illinoinensis TaxID=32201 RepID=UPI001C720A68|nr:E3 ubiquitin-protein ligase APD2-like isoform X1 [Carya illinoinensis]XP_042955582.1 E3 ubiquitin-protein ligase APD2-like isoform X1 [Carya illinoinensis]